MSQEKVELKKNKKQNVKKAVRKRKIENAATTAIISVVCLAIVGWIGFSVYTKVSAYREANKEYTYNEIDSAALSDYISSLSADDAE